MDLIDLIRILE